MQSDKESIPSFGSFVNNIEAAWQSALVASPRHPPPVLAAPQRQSFRIAPSNDVLPLSASSSRSTDILDDDIPPSQSDPFSSTFSVRQTCHFQPRPPKRPAGCSHQDRHNYWDVVMGPRQELSHIASSTTNKVYHSITRSSSTINKRSSLNNIYRSVSIQQSLQEHSAPSLNSVVKHQLSLQQRPRPDRPTKLSSSTEDLERPFACHSCTMRFRKRCNLMTHISNVHEKIRPFYCPLCLRRFARKSNCAKHMRLVHHLAKDRIQVRKVHEE